MAAFRAASAIDPATLREVIVSLAIAIVLGWSALYLRRVMAHGWDKLDMAHIGMGVFLSLILCFFVFWTMAKYGAGS